MSHHHPHQHQNQHQNQQQHHHHQHHHQHHHPDVRQPGQMVVAGGSGLGGHGASSGSLKKELPANGKKTKGRVRIKMEFIHNKLRRYTTFSKRKTGIMKKAFELATLTGTQVMLLVASETGHVYTFATRKLQPMIISDAGKALIQTCLNSPDSQLSPGSSSSSTSSGSGSGSSSSASLANQQQQLPTGFEETELSYSVNDELNDKPEQMNMMCEDSILATTFTTANLSSPSCQMTESRALKFDEARDDDLQQQQQPPQQLSHLHHHHQPHEAFNSCLPISTNGASSSSGSVIANSQTFEESLQNHPQQTIYSQQSANGQLHYNGDSMTQSINMMTVCNGNPRQQMLQRKLEQDLNRRGLNNSSNGNLQTNFNNSISHQQQQQQQQQQQNNGLQQQHHFGQSQMDLSEECNGLFVEYQTNRNSLGGLEELNSLNVSNCDSETLEEHINLLSSEDCFATNDDLQDFGIGSSNDHFLNIFSMNSTQSTPTGLQGSQIEKPGEKSGDNMGQLSMTSYEAPDMNCAQIDKQNSLTNEQQHQQQQQQQQQPSQRPMMQQSGTKKATKNKSKIALTTSEIDVEVNNKNCGPSKNQTKRKKNPVSREPNHTVFDTPSQQQQQHKITTTNTNKRLSPKKSTSNQTAPVVAKNDVKRTSCVSNVWMASPPSTSNTSNSSALSPSSSSSSQFEYEAPYRLQLENLRKKLKMDVAPMSSLSTDQQSLGKTSSTTTKEEVNTHQIANILPAQTNGSMFMNQHSGSSSVKANNCATTYVIARPIDAHNFETGGTIYLRTANGLVPINSDRRTGLPLVNLNSVEQQEYSSTSSLSSNQGPTTNNQLMMNCVGAGASQFLATTTTGTSVSSHGSGAVIFQASPQHDQRQTQQQAVSSAPVKNAQNHVSGPTPILISTETADALKGVKGVPVREPLSNQGLFGAAIMHNCDINQGASKANQQAATTADTSSQPTAYEDNCGQYSMNRSSAGQQQYQQ